MNEKRIRRTFRISLYTPRVGAIMYRHPHPYGSTTLIYHIYLVECFSPIFYSLKTNCKFHLLISIDFEVTIMYISWFIHYGIRWWWWCGIGNPFGRFFFYIFFYYFFFLFQHERHVPTLSPSGCIMDRCVYERINVEVSSLQ